MPTLLGTPRIIGRPGHHMRCCGTDLVITAWTAIDLRRRRSGQRAHVPVSVGVGFQSLVGHRRGANGLVSPSILPSHGGQL
jgi:hypothetical protein